MSSFSFNTILFTTLGLFILFFQPILRDMLIQQFILPHIVQLGAPKVTYKQLYINHQYQLIGKNIHIYDDLNEKFLAINHIMLEPRDFLNPQAGVEKIKIDQILLLKKPIFKTKDQQSAQNQEKARNNFLIPIDIAQLQVNKLTLKPQVTQYHKDIYFKMKAGFRQGRVDFNLRSRKNQLAFKGKLYQNFVDGRLLATDFNINDFYQIDPDLSRLTLNGMLDVKGSFSQIPALIGKMKVQANYQSMPFEANIQGDYHNQTSKIQLDVATLKQKFLETHIAIDSAHKGTLDLKLKPSGLPLKLQQKLPVTAQNLTIMTDFSLQNLKQPQFSNGAFQAEQIKVKKTAASTPVQIDKMSFNFAHKSDILAIRQAKILAVVDNVPLNADLQADLKNYYNPTHLVLDVEKEADKNQTINMVLKANKNKHDIDINIEKFTPNFILDRKVRAQIQQINAQFTGDVQLFSVDPLKSLNGHLTSKIQQAEQGVLELDLDVKKGDMQAHYVFLNADKKIGDGEIISVQDFKNISLTTQIDLEAVSYIIPYNQHLLKGNVQLNMHMHQGVLVGDMSLKGGRYENRLYGTKLKNISLLASIHKDYIQVKSLTANEDNPRKSIGKITGQGRISLSPTRQSDFILKTERLTPIKDDIFTGKIDSKLKLTGTSNQLKLIGNVTFDDVLILLPNIEKTTIPKLNIIREEVQKLSKNTQSPLAKNSQLSAMKSSSQSFPALENIQADIKIMLKEGAKVTGFGLQGFPYGTLNLKGTLAEPYVDGQINIARGTLELLGETFNISDGGIHLKKSNPLLNIQAKRSVDDIEITLTLKGTIDNPSIGFSTMPAIAQDEIIALLIFGKNKQELSPFQALRLANAFYQLSRGKSGVGGKLDVLGNTERFLDIDHLSINSDTNNSVSIGAGKYINDRIYVGTDFNPTTTDSAFILDLKLSETIALKALLSSSNQRVNSSEIMLIKRKDY